VYFKSLTEQPNGDRWLPAIQVAFNELESLKKTLESLAESCEEFAQDVSLIRPITFKGFAKIVYCIITNSSINLYSLNFISFSRALKLALSSTK
jgi:L-fucose mutarotase/ribose pyranase (RbsD/FucU family)